MADLDKDAQVHAWWRTHRASIERHLRALTGRAESVEDLVTETFIRAFEAYDAFEGRSSVSTWLHGIARNVARNARSKRHRREALAPPPAPDTHGSNPEDESRRRQAIDRFYAALDTLDAGLREIFVMRVIEERKLQEIAQRLNMPVSTVHAKAQKAAAHVRAQVEGKEHPATGRDPK